MVGERTRSTALLLVLIVFVLGIAVGALGMYTARNRVLGATVHQPLPPEKARARRVAELTKELDLSPEQQKQLDTILAQMHAQYAAVHDQENAQREQVSKQGRDQIRAILTAEQAPKFNDFLQRLDAERKKRNSGQ
jgi:Spy/CpxP family protein refolding chaperone